MKPERIYLVGFMGVGKTTTGALLARRLGWSFVDLDDEIRKQEKMSIRELFRIKGETYFRRLEGQVLRDISRKASLVIATGGGTFAIEENILYMQRTGVAIRLRCSLKQVLSRCRESQERPLLDDTESIQALMDRREPFYRRAPVQMETDDVSPGETVEKILIALSVR
ncbi:MAG: shikimate kinase [Acidobacteria bacterium]|nr:shikimate kinase [Acidobacteriota bacterium]